MKMIVAVILAFVAVSHALNEEPVAIVKSEFVQQPEGSYQFGFESANGIVRDETGEVKEVLDEDKKPHKVVTVRGFYSYPNENGKVDTINYFADETGYHAEGESIPKASSRK